MKRGEVYKVVYKKLERRGERRREKGEGGKASPSSQTGQEGERPRRDLQVQSRRRRAILRELPVGAREEDEGEEEAEEDGDEHDVRPQGTDEVHEGHEAHEEEEESYITPEEKGLLAFIVLWGGWLSVGGRTVAGVEALAAYTPVRVSRVRRITKSVESRCKGAAKSEPETS